jgi:uncharacterized protein
MEIRVDTLQESPFRLDFVEPLEKLPLLTGLVASGGAVFDGPLTGELLIRRSGNVVEVEGSLTCTVGLACSRCLQPSLQPLTLAVELSFERQLAPVEAAAELELSEADLGLIPFFGDVLDLRETLEQEVLLAIPQHPLCRDDCAGLCPVCGGDRNRQVCDCSPPVFHGGFAALKGLSLER